MFLDYNYHHSFPNGRKDVNVIAQRAYIRNIPGCRSFFHSKGKNLAVA